MSDSLAVSYPKVKEEYGDYNFKVVLIGDASVGKTSALKRFRYGTFSERPANTIGVDFTNRTLEIEGKIVQVLERTCTWPITKGCGCNPKSNPKYFHTYIDVVTISLH